MDRVGILVVDDHAMFRDGLRAVLEHAEDIDLLGEAGDAGSAIRLVAELRPEIVLMDLNLPGRGGIEAMREIRAGNPSVKLIALTMYHDPAMVDAVIKVGAQGYLLKERRAAELVAAIRTVAGGGAVIDPGIAARMLDNYREMLEPDVRQDDLSFSERELSLLRMLSQGDSNRSMAVKLELSEQTIKNLLSRMYRRLDVRSRTDAVKVAWRRGLIRQDK